MAMDSEGSGLVSRGLADHHVLHKRSDDPHHLTFGFVVFASKRLQEELVHAQFRLTGIVTLL